MRIEKLQSKKKRWSIEIITILCLFDSAQADVDSWPTHPKLANIVAGRCFQREKFGSCDYLTTGANSFQPTLSLESALQILALYFQDSKNMAHMFGSDKPPLKSRSNGLNLQTKIREASDNCWVVILSLDLVEKILTKWKLEFDIRSLEHDFENKIEKKV